MKEELVYGEDELLPFQKHKAKVMVKKEAETSDKFGCIPEERPTEVIINYGIVNIDKPSGPTSHQVSAYVKQILEIKKAGHAGTLDPKVTGVLPVALNRATKIIQTIQRTGKVYIALIHFHKPIDYDSVKKAIIEMSGVINQLPPRKSAVKRRVRQREIYFVKVLDFKDDRDLLVKIGCQAGTYIRKWAHDLGVKVKNGAHMKELRRIRAGMFDESTLCTLQDLKDAYYYYKEEDNDKYLRHLILPVETGVKYLPKVWILDSAVNAICQGINLNVPGIAKLSDDIMPNKMTAIMTLKNELVALGYAVLSSKDIMEKDKGLAIKTHKVFMQPGTYPKVSV